MTTEEKLDFEHRLTAVEDRSKSNTKRLDDHDEAIKENSNLISSIKELAMETKYMRADLNETIAKVNKLENLDKEKASKDGDKWEKFKWLLVGGLVTIILNYLALSLGLK